MDAEVLEIFGSEKQDKKANNDRINLCYSILSSENLNLNQKSIQLLCNYVKKKESPLGSVVCTCIAKSSCVYMSTTTDKDAHKVFQNSISAILKFQANSEDETNQQGVILALLEMMNKHASSVQGKLVTEIHKIAYDGIQSSNEETALTSASLLASCCTSLHHFTTILDKLLLTIQRVLNLGFTLVVGETGSKKSNLITIIEETEEGFLPKKDRYQTDFIQRLFKTVCFTLSKLLTQSYNFLIQINLEKIVDFVQFSLLLDSQLMKFQDKSSQQFSPSQLRKVLPVFHSSALLIYNALVTSFKSHLLPWISSLNEILIQKLKGCKPDQPLFKNLINSAIICLSNLGGSVSKHLCFEIVPVLVQNIFDLNKMQQLVISTKKSQEKKEQYNVSIINQAKISCQLLEKVFKISSFMFLDIISTCTHLITILINSLTKWFDHKDEPMIPILPSLYKLLLSSLMFGSMVHTQSPFLGVSISLFRKGIATSIPNISIECYLALNIIEMIMHPRSAPLYIPHGETIENYSLKRKDKETNEEVVESEEKEEKVEKKRKIEKEIILDESVDESYTEENTSKVEESEDNLDDSNVSETNQEEEEGDEEKEEEISDIEDDLDKKKLKGTGGIYVTKKMFEKIMSQGKKKQVLDLESDEENKQKQDDQEEDQGEESVDQEDDQGEAQEEEESGDQEEVNDSTNEQEEVNESNIEESETLNESEDLSQQNESNIQSNENSFQTDPEDLSEIEDDLDEEKLKGTGGMYISKDQLKKMKSSKEEDIESIQSDDPDEEKDISTLKLDF